MDGSPLPNPKLPRLKARPIDGHKGTFGTVGIIGGSAGNPGGPDELKPRMIGAPALVALGANAAGCGLVKVGAPEPILNAVLTIAPMATGFPIGIAPKGNLIPTHAKSVLDRLMSESDTLVIGPGLGAGKEIEQLVHSAVSMERPSRCKALVVDADAINAFCKLSSHADHTITPTVMTPHPGEAGRLLNALEIQGTPDGTENQRIKACASLATRLGCVVVLKGKGTVVCDQDRVWVCKNGHPCLATGGTGDVLAGVIGSLAAQCVDDPDIDLFASTCIAVDAHASSGQQWATQTNSQSGLDPRQLCNHLTNSITSHRDTMAPADQ